MRFATSFLCRLTAWSPIRRLLGRVFAAGCRQHLAGLDRASSERLQRRSLLGMIYRAKNSVFGRDHDFSRIRTPDDFRRLIPLRRSSELSRLYGQPGHTWPGHYSSLAGRGEVAWASPSWLLSQRKAMQTALALAMTGINTQSFFEGPLWWLGDQPRTFVRRESSWRDWFSLSRFPLSLIPYVEEAPGVSVLPGESADLSVPVTAARIADESPSCLVGPAERIIRVVDSVRQLRHLDKLSDLWPNLGAVLYHRRNAEIDRRQLTQRLGDRVTLLEVLSRPEGTLAVEDPRYGGLRLLLNHGVYFEFIPLEQAHQLYPTRLGIEHVKPQATYELALSSCAGVWACRIGMAVRFNRIDPPLVQVVPLSPPTSELPLRTNAVDHPQTVGIPGVRTETSLHMPWSTPVDRG